MVQLIFKSDVVGQATADTGSIQMIAGEESSSSSGHVPAIVGLVIFGGFLVSGFMYFFIRRWQLRVRQNI